MKQKITNNQIKEDKDSYARIELEIDAKKEIEWFRRYSPNLSTEELLFDTAKYLVTVKKKSDRQEEFLTGILGVASLGSIFMGVLALVSGDWSNLLWAIIIFVASLVISIYVYKQKR